MTTVNAHTVRKSQPNTGKIKANTGAEVPDFNTSPSPMTINVTKVK